MAAPRLVIAFLLFPNQSTEEYPVIAQRARKENATLYWADETGVSNCENSERGFSPQGYPPILPIMTKKERVNIISALNSQGQVRYMLYEDSMNQQRLTTFIRNMPQTSKQNIFLILDNLKVHHGKMVPDWVPRRHGKTELFFLPPYALESNPDEYLNHALKLSVHFRDLPEIRSDIHHKTNFFMRALQQNKDNVSAFFRHPLTSYAFVREYLKKLKALGWQAPTATVVSPA